MDPPGSERGEAPANATQRTPHRSASAVEVTFDDTNYLATQHVTLSNDYGGAPAARVHLATPRGGVMARPGQRNAYEVEAVLHARGPTEQSARNQIAAMHVVARDRLGQGKLFLDVDVELAAAKSDFPWDALDTLGGTPRWADIVATLPAEADHDLDAQTTDDALAVTGLRGQYLDLQTTTGRLAVDGQWAAARLRTTYGDLDLSGEYSEASATTERGSIFVRGTYGDFQAVSQSGEIRGTVHPQDGARHALSTEDGPIHWDLEQTPLFGLNLTAASSRGQAQLSVAGVATQGQGELHQAVHADAWQVVTVQASSDRGDVVLSAPAVVAVGNRPFDLQVGTALLGLGAIAVAAKLFGGRLLALFTRLDTNQVLNHRRRQAIMDHVTENPGRSFSDLRRDIGLPNGVLVHHLRVLAAHGLLVSKGRGNRRCYYAPRAAVHPYLTTVQARILAALDAEPGITQQELRDRVGIPRGTLGYHLGVLRDAGLLHEAKKGRFTRYAPTAPNAVDNAKPS